jgi:hypothetical protein
MYAYGTMASLAIVMLLASPVWGTGDKWDVSPKPPETPVFQTNLVPLTDGAPLDVRKFEPHPDRPRTQGILATTTWLKGAFSTETEVNTNQRSPRGDGHSGRTMRLGIVGSAGLVRYGMTYRTADQTFSQRSAQERKEAWGEWKNGATAIRSTVGQQDDHSGDWAKQSYNRIDISWKKGAWPNLGFSYAHNAAAHTMDAVNLFPQRNSPHNVEAAIGYSWGIWDARLTSGYGIETDLLNHGAQSQIQTETMTASFRPVSTLTITPTLGYRAERPEWSSARIDSPSASLTMNYKQSQRVTVTAMGNYFGLRSTDKLIDLENIGGKGVVSWELEPLRHWKPQLSLEGGYNLQVNRLMPSQTENISGLLRLVLATR